MGLSSETKCDPGALAFGLHERAAHLRHRPACASSSPLVGEFGREFRAGEYRAGARQRGAIEPSLRDAEIKRVERKRPDNLDAYDLVLRAIPQVYVAMPENATDAMPALERALALEADYPAAQGLLAWCHEILFVRAGFKEDNRVAAIRHARAAVTHGRDDATALSLGAFVIGMVSMIA